MHIRKGNLYITQSRHFEPAFVSRIAGNQLSSASSKSASESNPLFIYRSFSKLGTAVAVYSQHRSGQESMDCILQKIIHDLCFPFGQFQFTSQILIHICCCWKQWKNMNCSNAAREIRSEVIKLRQKLYKLVCVPIVSTKFCMHTVQSLIHFQRILNW